MDKNYYHQYYDYERYHWWFRARAKIIRDRLKRLPDTDRRPRILNVGAATGFSTELLMEFGEVTSVEYDPDCCTFLQEKLGIEAIRASITDLPFSDAAFDLVCAFDVIEHVDDDSKAVDELTRVTAPGGIIFVTVPAYMDLWSSHDEINHHRRRYTRKQVKALFSGRPARPLRATYFNSILFLPVWIARKVMNRFPGKSHTDKQRSDFEVANGKFINTILYGVFSLERPVLRVMNFPFGVSILLLLKKEPK